MIATPSAPSPASLPAPSRRADLVLALWLLAFAVATRAAVLGDLAYFNDESFYWLVARRMHAGLWPYADVWDRKGPGLFATYWLATAIWPSLAACRGLALVFAAATGWVVARITRRWAGDLGGWLAATLYLATLPMFVGGGAQPQVFYNLYIALAALLVLDAAEVKGGGRGLIPAMLLAGLAITYKQTAACEAAFLGIWVLWRQTRLGLDPAKLAGLALRMMLAGIVPFALFALVFAASGHFAPFWHAMVSSNLKKSYDPWGDHWSRIRALATVASPLLVLALPGLALGAIRLRKSTVPRGFLAGWVAAALAGLVIIPNFYADYMLPLMVPLSICAGCTMARRPWGTAGGAVAIFIFVVAGPALDFSARRAASDEVAGLARDIAARNPHPRLLVYEGPMALYALVGSAPPSPLLDNFHLNFPFENNTSTLDTANEMQRIIAWRPDVVVVYHAWPPAQENPRTAQMVRAYLQGCRWWWRRTYHEIATTQPIDVYGDCAPRT